MNKTHWMAIVGGLAMSLCASAQDMGLIEDQYIVRLHAPMVGDLPDTVDALLGTNPGSQLLHTYDTVLFGFAARMSAAQAEALIATGVDRRVGSVDHRSDHRRRWLGRNDARGRDEQR